jgi:O-antigen ligase
MRATPEAASPVRPSSPAQPFPVSDFDPRRGKVAFVFAMIYLAIIISRILDVTVSFLKIPLITSVAMCVALLFSGNALALLSKRMGLLLCTFTFWLGLTSVAGVWRTGSLPSAESAVMSLALVFVLVGSITTPQRLKKALYVFGFSSLVAVSQSFFFGDMSTGRLQISRGTFKDPNIYAITLLVGIPFLLFFVGQTRLSIFKLFGIAGVLLLLKTILYTGSRGSLIAMGVLALLLFFRVSAQQKLVLMLGMAVLLPAAYIMSPEYLKLRYLTLFSSDVQTTDERLREKVEGGDLASTESRLALIQASLRMTFHHPVFGVGPGNFPTANFDEIQRETGRKVWLVSHNSYTQVSSETGIPGFLIFVAMLGIAVRDTQKVLSAARSPRPPPPLLVDCAGCINLATITIGFGAFFLSIAYEPMIYILIGLSIIADQLLVQYRSTSPVPPTSITAPTSGSFLAGAKRIY